jgi:hypothetical protein
MSKVRPKRKKGIPMPQIPGAGLVLVNLADQIAKSNNNPVCGFLAVGAVVVSAVVDPLGTAYALARKASEGGSGDNTSEPVEQ